MDLIPVKSSAVDAVGFDPATSQITVVWKNGSEHQYPASEQEFRELLVAPSVGRFVNTRLK